MAPKTSVLTAALRAGLRTSGPTGEAHSLLISEIFGPTFSGEGMSVGQRCSFVRLAACNLTCSWCDTAYTWDWTGKNGTVYRPKDETSWWTMDAIVEAVLSHQTEHLIVSGGEPLLQSPALAALLSVWRARLPAERRERCTVEVETNGTIAPGPSLRTVVDRFNVSPKLAHAGNGEPPDLRPWSVRTRHNRSAILKFVVRARPDQEAETVADLDEITALVAPHAIPPDAIWIMAEGVGAAGQVASMRRLAALVLARGWNLSPRLHVLLWENTRGT